MTYQEFMECWKRGATTSYPLGFDLYNVLPMTEKLAQMYMRVCENDPVRLELLSRQIHSETKGSVVVYFMSLLTSLESVTIVKDRRDKIETHSVYVKDVKQ